MIMLPLSQHARRRSQQRGVCEDDIALAIEKGIRIHRTGVTFYFVGRRQIASLGDKRIKLNGLTVLQSVDGEIVTVYKNPQALRRIKRKLGRRLSCF